MTSACPQVPLQSFKLLLPQKSSYQSSLLAARSHAGRATCSQSLRVSEVGIVFPPSYILFYHQHKGDAGCLYFAYIHAGSAMELLAQLHALLPQDLQKSPARVRQLWPFLRHHLASVRTAAVELFTSLTGERPLQLFMPTYLD